MGEHSTASEVLRRIASGFFALAFDSTNPDRPVHYGVWSVLRAVATVLGMRGALELRPIELELLRDALAFCPPSKDREYIESLTFREKVNG